MSVNLDAWKAWNSIPPQKGAVVMGVLANLKYITAAQVGGAGDKNRELTENPSVK